MGDFRVFAMTDWLELLTGMDRKQHIAVFEEKIPSELTYENLYPKSYAELREDSEFVRNFVYLGMVEDIPFSELLFLADYKPRVDSAIHDTIIILAKKR